MLCSSVDSVPECWIPMHGSYVHLIFSGENRVNVGFPVARTPSKLVDALLSKGVPQSVITAQLLITEGDVKDVESVKKALCPAGKTADVIISGIGKFF